MFWLRDWIDIPAYVLGLAAFLLVVVDRRRWLLALLAFQYALAAWLMLGVMQPAAAGALLAAGWLAVLILGLSLQPGESAFPAGGVNAFPTNLLFRIAVGALGVLASIGALRAQLVQLSALAPIYVLGGFFPLISGFMQLGFSSDPLRVATGLLSILCGFTTVYIAIEPSLAIVALLALVHLGIALTCAYVLIQARAESVAGDGQR